MLYGGRVSTVKFRRFTFFNACNKLPFIYFRIKIMGINVDNTNRVFFASIKKLDGFRCDIGIEFAHFVHVMHIIRADGDNGKGNSLAVHQSVVFDAAKRRFVFLVSRQICDESVAGHAK